MAVTAHNVYAYRGLVSENDVDDPRKKRGVVYYDNYDDEINDNTKNNDCFICGGSGQKTEPLATAVII